MDNNWSLESILQRVLFPLEFFLVIIVLVVYFVTHHCLLLLSGVSGGSGGFFRLIFVLVSFELEVETNRQLEIQLDGSALVGSLQRVVDFNIDFRTVESTITWVKFPGLSILIECLFECSFSLIPQFFISQSISRSSGKFQFKFEVKGRVSVIQEIQTADNFIHNLFRSTENMRIILLEPSDSGQP